MNNWNVYKIIVHIHHRYSDGCMQSATAEVRFTDGCTLSGGSWDRFGQRQHPSGWEFATKGYPIVGSVRGLAHQLHRTPAIGGSNIAKQPRGSIATDEESPDRLWATSRRWAQLCHITWLCRHIRRTTGFHNRGLIRRSYRFHQPRIRYR